MPHTAASAMTNTAITVSIKNAPANIAKEKGNSKKKS
jgi:hypothetical protein